jgi:hypothetical protein
MSSRRNFISTVSITLLGLLPALSWAAPPTVEIIAMAHPPVQSALKPLREWLAGQAGKVRVVEIDAESSPGEKRLETIGLKGHVPIAILIDGKTAFQRKNGSAVNFINFPAVKESPAGIRGDWLTEDVQAAVVERLGKAGR